MSKNNDGGPAFPIPMEDWRDIPGHPAPGMTLRDYLAAQSLMGMRVSNPNGPADLAATLAYMDADAMLARREVTND